MFPLQSFLLSLENDGIRLDVRDYDRIAMVLSTDGDWTLKRLRDVLLVLLAKDTDQRDLVGKRFDNFFARNLPDKPLAEADIAKLRAELENYKAPRPAARVFPAKFKPSKPSLPQTPPKSRARKYLWLNVGLGIVLLLGAVGYGVWVWWKSPPAIAISPAPIFTIQPGAEQLHSITLRNPGRGRVAVKNISVRSETGAFTLQEHDCTILAGEKTCQAHVRFQADEEGSHQATLKIDSDAGTFPTQLTGHSRKPIEQPKPSADSIDKLPLYPIQPRAPVIGERIESPIEGKYQWLLPVALAAFFLILSTVFGRYLKKIRQVPLDKPADWEEGKPQHFPLERIGGKPSPRLDDDTLSHLADCMGYFRSEQAGRHPDIYASVLETVKHGGIPHLVFHRRKQLRHLIILVDAQATEALSLNPVAEELREGMQRLGVSLIYGHFYGDPAVFYTGSGQVRYLEDLETERRAYLLLVFSDSKGLRRSRYTLECLTRWPLTAWFDLRAPELREAASALPAQYDIPLYSASATGLLQAFTRFLTESAPLSDDTTVCRQQGKEPAQAWNGVPAQGETPMPLYLETLLGDALPWAQACAMVQPITLGLADKLRREFYPYLLPERIERLNVLPDTQRDAAGLRFSSEVLAELRQGFATRHPSIDNEQLSIINKQAAANEKSFHSLSIDYCSLSIDLPSQEEVLKFILAELKKTWQAYQQENPDELEKSLAQLAWEKHYQRVNLELDPDDALKRLSELSGTPLGNTVKASMKQLERVPLRKEPGSKDARQRLSRLKGEQTLQAYPLKKWQWAVSFLLILATFGNLGWGAWAWWQSRDLTARVLVASEDSVQLSVISYQKRSGEDWLPVGEKTGLPSEMNVPPGETYRLAFYGRDENTVLHDLELGKVSNNLSVRLSSEIDTASGRTTASLVATNPAKQVLKNTQVFIRGSLFNASVAANRTAKLPSGTYQVSIEDSSDNCLGITDTCSLKGFDWQTTTLEPGKKIFVEFDKEAYFRDVLKDGGVGPAMVSISAGTFQMGEGDEKHEVTLDAFAIGRYEVTFAEYDAFCEATGREKPNDRGWGRGNLPVINVSWEDATAYAAWLTEQTDTEYRLPTEAEWEYMTRAGTDTKYWWGDEALHEYENYGTDECCDGFVQGKDVWFYTSPVGSLQPNPFGIYDTSGNVLEWVQDWYGDYPTEAQTNPKGSQEGSDRVIRGGGWVHPPSYVRSADRGRGNPANRYGVLGFRLARTNPRPSYPAERPKPQEYPTFRDKLKDQTARAPEMVGLQSGTFSMGSEDGDDDEKPIHEVTLGKFAIGKYEVTFEEYDAFCDATNRKKPEDEGWGRGKRPVINVSWEDAQAYAEWLSKESGYTYRLPTEAEWEYAARAGTETKYWWGDTASHEYANYGKDECCDGLAEGKDQWVNTSPVDSFDANSFGLHDTAGNVWEWTCSPWKDKYEGQELGCEGEEGSDRVIRGGGWGSSPSLVRSASRNGRYPAVRYDYLGFRLARTGPWPYYPTEPEKPKMVPFEQGATFTMGSEKGNDDEKPVHEVTLLPFEIGAYEVTVSEFLRFVEAENYRGEKPGAEWRCKDFMRPDFEQEDSHPVVCITWNDVQAYITWLNGKLSMDPKYKYRLPSEAEWEYAARGGVQTEYWWGDDAGKNNANCDGCGDEFEFTSPKASFAPNLYGLYDTAGNVWEWVNDWFGEYSTEAQTDPQGPEKGSSRVIRGGSWGGSPSLVRSAGRGRLGPAVRYDYLGFRLARTLPRPSYPSPPSPEMVSLPGGTFKMGSDKGRDDEKPVHDVTLDPFDIGKYEVTVGEFRRFVEAMKYETEAEKKGSCYGYDKDGNWDEQKGLNWRNLGFEQDDNHPVICVSWNDAMAYAQWLSAELGESYTLPSEAEWEYAARAGSVTERYWGDDEKDACGYGNVHDQTSKRENKFDWTHHECDDGYAQTAPVGQFTANDFELNDMLGNVWEWTLDWYGEKYYADSPKKNPKGPEKGSDRVIRGGSWLPPRPSFAPRAGLGGTPRTATTTWASASRGINLDPLTLLPLKQRNSRKFRKRRNIYPLHPLQTSCRTVRTVLRWSIFPVGRLRWGIFKVKAMTMKSRCMK